VRDAHPEDVDTADQLESTVTCTHEHTHDMLRAERDGYQFYEHHCTNCKAITSKSVVHTLTWSMRHGENAQIPDA
jgi:hypothetical protein